MTVTSTGESGSCTLRGAITAVNTNNSGTPCGQVLNGDLTPIKLPANTYTPFNGQLQIASGAKIEIIGAKLNDPAKTVIDASGHSRVFEVLSGGQLKLKGVKVTGGHTPNGAVGVNPGQYGGSSPDGGGILNAGSLTLDHVLLTGNRTGHGGEGANGDPLSMTSTRDARSGGAGGSGGGIYNAATGTLVVTASTISHNGTGAGGDGGTGAMGRQGVGNFPSGSDGGDGGPAGAGGGIRNLGNATITDSTVSYNTTGHGGDGGHGGQGASELAGPGGSGAGRGGYGGDGGTAGYYHDEYNGKYSLSGPAGGGGIFNANGGVLVMTGSTISHNITGDGGNGGGEGIGGKYGSNQFLDGAHAGWAGSGGHGGGLFNSFGTATLTNVTIADNQTGNGGKGGAGAQSASLGPGPGGFGGYGAGIWSDGAHSPYYVQLTNVTISKNFVGFAGHAGAAGNPPFPGAPGEKGKGTALATGGRYDTNGSGIYEKNTLINGVVGSGDALCFQYYAPSHLDILDQGNNLSYPNDASCPGVHGNPKLGPLLDNGGLTETLLPAPGSAAIGVVPPASCTVTTDQRGSPRPGKSGPNCDIGAVEATPDKTAPNTVDLTGPGSVRLGKPATYKFRSSEPGSKFRCKVDGGAFKACSSPFVTRFGSAGKHTVKVAAVDAAGNADKSPASISTTVRKKGRHRR